MKKYLPAACFGAQVVLLTLALTFWWAHRNNHLFGNPHWLLGKDMGKFVFYTYQYMFRPIEDGHVNLNGEMGNQELLYHLPEGPQRHLQQIEFEAAVSSNGYLWIELQKENQSMLACRVARKKKYKSGFFLFDAKGRPKQHTPFFIKDFKAPEKWGRFCIKRNEKRWELQFEGRRVGSVADELLAKGYFGFRGSGDLSAKVLIRNVTLSFSDPNDPNKSWEEREPFETDRFWAGTLGYCFWIATGILLLRLGRQRMLAATLPGPAGQKYINADNIALTIILASMLMMPRFTSGVHIVGALALGELASVVALKLSKQGIQISNDEKNIRILPIGLMGCICLLSAMAFMVHGQWLGRADRSIWSNLKNIHPKAFQTHPASEGSAAPFTLKDPMPMVPGKPLFAAPFAYREQKIDLLFAMAVQNTLDIVFQQQSYQTHGDPEGEWLPLQRRLIRLSTREGVPWGFSTRTRTQTAPFIPINGVLYTGQTNRLSVEATRGNIRIWLNDAKTDIDGFEPLGFGETGFGVFEKGITLHRVQVTPVKSIAEKKYLQSGLGLLLPVAVIFLLWALLRPLAGATWQDSCRAGVAALFLPACYLLASLALPSEDLAYLGAHRLGWLDLALFGFVLSLFHLFPMLQRRLKAGVWLSNALLFALIFALALFVWDVVLPAEHPLRLRFGNNIVAPAAASEKKPSQSVLWYADNQLASANTYVWHQKFGGRSITLTRTPGVQRIFTMGGSQAWGSGAGSTAETYNALLEKQLQDKGRSVEIYNAGVNGSGLKQVAATFRDLVIGFDPDILILDVGLNDSVAIQAIPKANARQSRREQLIRHFRSIVDICHRHGVEMLLVQEAMNQESGLRCDPVLYDTLEKIAVEAGFTVIDAYAHFKEKQRDHLVWWDPAHFAPTGHHLLADLLTPAVETIMDKR